MGGEIMGSLWRLLTYYNDWMPWSHPFRVHWRESGHFDPLISKWLCLLSLLLAMVWVGGVASLPHFFVMGDTWVVALRLLVAASVGGMICLLFFLPSLRNYQEFEETVDQVARILSTDSGVPFSRCEWEQLQEQAEQLIKKLVRDIRIAVHPQNINPAELEEILAQKGRLSVFRLVFRRSGLVSDERYRHCYQAAYQDHH